tara:strand:+ start:2491 stop:4584 length:2094 start_codon:yes stop_codon:yes gene_type:complete
MYTIELYIQGKRVDLFDDESVKITDSIQNIKDIDKVFTAFTQTFSLPASKLNNQIFKHYYDFNIDNGFDARIKVDATIELNALPFRTGKIKLEGVDLKDRKAHTYRVTFFGDIVKLKDQLGEDKLSDLDLSLYDRDYDSATVIGGMFSTYPLESVITPLITHSQRLFYSATTHVQGSGNLHYTSGGGGSNLHGVKWNELKFALRVNRIIKAIEDDYNLKFSTDFFRNVNVKEIEDMFLWLHRKSGYVEDLSGATQKETLVNFNQIANTDLFYIYNTTFQSFYTTSQLQALTLSVYPASGYGTTPYGVRIEENGIVIYNSGVTLTGTQVLSEGTDFAYLGGYYEVYVETTLDMQFSTIQWNGEAYNGVTFFVTYATGFFQATSTFRFNAAKQAPDIKILDFLTGLFKLFNLTAYVEDGIIIVKPLDDFYSEGKGHFLGTEGIDITQYIDIDSHKVDVALPFKEVKFKFKDTKTFLANRFGEIVGRQWGEVFYDAGETNLDGGLYQIEAPFGHLQYERLNDATSGALKDIQWGYNVNNEQSPYLGKPLLFYPKLIDTINGISIIDEVDDDNKPVSHTERLKVFMPFNTVSLDPAVNDFQLNYFQETNEWTRNENGQIFTGDLFSRYYKNYIKGVFNPKQRLVKVSAYLPLNFLLNYKLSDRLVIADQQYKINSISTNLKTGKSELELLIDRINSVQQFP